MNPKQEFEVDRLLNALNSLLWRTNASSGDRSCINHAISSFMDLDVVKFWLKAPKDDLDEQAMITFDQLRERLNVEL